MALALWLGLAGRALAADPELECSRPDEAAAHIARLSLAELEYAEDVHREAHWNALGDCAARSDPDACRAVETRRFDRLWRERRAAIEARYRRLFDDYAARCWTPLTRPGVPGRELAAREVSAPTRSRCRAPS